MKRRHVRIVRMRSWFRIFAPYDTEVIRMIRLIPDRVYVSTTREWRVPATVESLRSLVQFAHKYAPQSARSVEAAFHEVNLAHVLSKAPYSVPGWWDDVTHPDEPEWDNHLAG